MRPGWATAAMLGGLPPCTAVDSTVGSWSPAEVYFTFTFGYCAVNPSMTCLKRLLLGAAPDGHHRDVAR